MKNLHRLAALTLLLLAGCARAGALTPPPPTEGPAPTAAAPTAALPTDTPPSPTAALTGVDALAAALTAGGATVEPAEGPSAGLFGLTPALLSVNGGLVEVYQFPDEAARQAAEATLPDLLAVTRWASPPHFYAQGSLIVLYVGAEPSITDALRAALGPELAAEDRAAETVDRVTLYLIALEDNGASGDPVGCGDSVVGVERPIAPTDAPLEAALAELFALRDPFYGESGLYNALYQSTLAVESATVDSGLATVYLSGDMLLGGVCDAPRFKAQIEYTILALPGVEAVQVLLNNTPLDDLLSGQG